METTITITAAKRPSHGKGPARRLRASGKLPAIVYGPGHEALSVSVDPKEVRQILSAPLGRNTVVTLAMDGSNQLALLKSFDYHPVTREFEHVDFYTVQLGRPIIVEVPFTTTGKAKGIAEGGVARQIYRRLKVKVSPDKIPSKIEADITNVELGASLHVRELTLPEGVTVMLDQGQTVFTVVAPEKEEKAAEAAPGAAPAAAAGAAAKPGAAAPAAGGKAPAAAAAKAPAAKDAKKK